MSSTSRRELVPCNLCGASETRLWAEVAGAQLVQCCRCSLVYTNPRPVLEALVGGYEEDYLTVHQDQELLRLRRLSYLVEKQEILRHVSGGRFLDIGCGPGEFLAAVADTFEVYGVDVSRTYIRYGREQLGLTNLREGQLSEAGFEDDFFEVAQLRGVLQHLPDPLGQLRECRRVLKPGGLLIISATPNIASLAARVFRGNFRLLAPDQMLYDFSPRTLRAMLDRAGFIVESLQFPYWNTPYRRWSDPLVFAQRALLLGWRRLTGGDTSGIRNPAFWGNMMTCYARKSPTP